MTTISASASVFGAVKQLCIACRIIVHAGNNKRTILTMRFFDFGTTFIIVAGLVLITTMFAIDGFSKNSHKDCCNEEGKSVELAPDENCWPARSIKCSRL